MSRNSPLAIMLLLALLQGCSTAGSSDGAASSALSKSELEALAAAARWLAESKIEFRGWDDSGTPWSIADESQATSRYFLEKSKTSSPNRTCVLQQYAEVITPNEATLDDAIKARPELSRGLLMNLERPRIFLLWAWVDVGFSHGDIAKGGEIAMNKLSGKWVVTDARLIYFFCD
jgi:hypothetical protein